MHRGEAKAEGEHEGLDREGLLQALGVRQGRLAVRDQEGVPQARQAIPPGRQRDDAKAEARFKDITEANDVLSDPSQAQGVRRGARAVRRRPDGPGRLRCAGTPGHDDVRPRRPVRRMGQGGGGAGGGLGDVFGGIFNRGGVAGDRDVGPVAGRTSSARSRSRSTRRWTGSPCRCAWRSDGPCPTCAGTGAQAGTVPRVCPACEGAGQRSPNAGGFAIPEPCRECRGRGLVVDDPCPICKGSGPGAVHPYGPGAHPGRGQGRPAHPAARQGRVRGERRGERRPDRAGEGRGRTRCSGATATTSPSPSP